ARPQQVRPEGLTRVRSREACADNPSPSAAVEGLSFSGSALLTRNGCAMSKILITSALPYINGVKHLGNLVGSLLPADVHARFRRQVCDEVVFICGADEHGTPAELGALAAGEDVRRYCDAQHAIQADVYRRFGLSFDHFGRSSCPQNHALTQHFHRRLAAAGCFGSYGRRPTGASCPTATCSAPARIAALATRAATSATAAAA